MAVYLYLVLFLVPPTGGRVVHTVVSVAPAPLFTRGKEMDARPRGGGDGAEPVQARGG